jgi:hypothetical protein
MSNSNMLDAANLKLLDWYMYYIWVLIRFQDVFEKKHVVKAPTKLRLLLVAVFCPEEDFR